MNATKDEALRALRTIEHETSCDPVDFDRVESAVRTLRLFIESSALNAELAWMYQELMK